MGPLSNLYYIWSLLSLEKVFLQLPSYGSVGASCYQSSDLAPHYGDMRSAATTGNYEDDDVKVMLDDMHICMVREEINQKRIFTLLQVGTVARQQIHVLPQNIVSLHLSSYVLFASFQ